MMLRSRVRHALGPILRQRGSLWRHAVAMDELIEAGRHTTARVFPLIIRPEPRRLEVAITSFCNLRCIGCRYGRDFMTGTQLSWPVVRDLLDDAKEIGVWDVRFYGGEPLLHSALPQMVGHAVQSGLQVHVTTNAILLAEHIDELYAAGLRRITIGFYGTGASYDGYVQQKDRFSRLEAGVAAVRQRYGDNVSIQRRHGAAVLRHLSAGQPSHPPVEDDGVHARPPPSRSRRLCCELSELSLPLRPPYPQGLEDRMPVWRPRPDPWGVGLHCIWDAPAVPSIRHALDTKHTAPETDAFCHTGPSLSISPC